MKTFSFYLYLILSVSVCKLGFASDTTPDLSTQLQLIESQIGTSNYEAYDQDKDQMLKIAINANIECLKSGFVKKLKRAESNLEIYQNNLKTSQNGTEVQHWMRKIESAEKKIKEMNEILCCIEMLRIKLTN